MPSALFYTLFCLFLLCSSLLPLPLHIATSVCTLPPSPSNILDPQVCSLIHCKVLVCLQLLDSLSTSVTDQVCFWLLSLLMLTGQILWPSDFSLPFFILPTEKKHFFTPYILFMPLTRLVVIMTFLIIFWSGLSLHVMVYGSFDQVPLQKQTLSFYTSLQINLI